MFWLKDHGDFPFSSEIVKNPIQIQGLCVESLNPQIPWDVVILENHPSELAGNFRDFLNRDELIVQIHFVSPFRIAPGKRKRHSKPKASYADPDLQFLRYGPAGPAGESVTIHTIPQARPCANTCSNISYVSYMNERSFTIGLGGT
jgi:hypothetical protein